MKNLKISSISLLIQIAFIISLNSFGQDVSKSDKYYGGFGYFMSGYQILNLEGINDAFKTSGFPEINNGSITVGGGGHYLFNNWLIGGEGYGLLGGSAENNLYKVIHAGGYGFFNIWLPGDANSTI